jgi:hypothetical protein
MIFRSCCCNPKTAFTAGSLESYTNLPGNTFSVAMSPLPVRGRPPAVVRTPEFTGRGPTADLHLQGAIWGLARTWGRSGRRWRRGVPGPPAAVACGHHRRGLEGLRRRGGVQGDEAEL